MSRVWNGLASQRQDSSRLWMELRDQHLLHGRSATSSEAHYCTFPETDIKPCPWRPITLRPFYLIFLTCVSLALLAAVEILRQLSSSNHGLAFFQDTTEISNALFVAYNYLPGIIAVIYAVLWSFVDLDVKRLEPYFQLSRPGGVPVSVLFVDYAFESVLLAPFRAIKRRHWLVAITSSVFLLISLLLPPLQSGLLGISPVSINNTVSFRSWDTLLDTQTQGGQFTAELVSHANSILSAGAPLPGFVTPDYAVAPFSTNGSTSTGNGTWSADMPVFWAKPSCHEFSYAAGFPKRPQVDDSSPPYTMLSWQMRNISLPDENKNSQNCSLSHSILMGVNTYGEPGVSYWPLWAGISSDPEVATTDGLVQQNAYVREGCTDYKYLAVLITLNTTETAAPRNDGDDSSSNNRTLKYEATAIGLMCKAQYFSTVARVTVQAKNKSVIALDILGEQGGNKSLDDGLFNAERFESYLNGEQSAFTGALDPNGNVGSGIMKAFPLSNHGSIATGSFNSIENSSTVDEVTFSKGISQAYKLAFSLALTDVFDKNTEHTSLLGSQTEYLIAITTTPALAIFSEVILALAALICLSLVFAYWRRENVLRSDPDSVAAICSLVADLFGHFDILKNSNSGLDLCSTERLLEVVANTSCHLRQDETAKKLESVSSADIKKPGNKTTAALDPLPFFVSRLGFLTAICTLLGAVVGFSIVLSFACKIGGFSYQASSRTLASQAFWSFTPALIATLIESGWTVTHRDLSVLEPWVRLKRGAATAQQSLSLNYASRPPIAVLINSLKCGHFILSSVSLACVLASILNVAMGGLFSQSFTTTQLSRVEFSTSYEQSPLPSNWDTGSYGLYKAFDLVRTNITDGTPMLPWTTDLFSFLPITVPADSVVSNGVYQAVTVGVGAQLDCEPFSIPNSVDESGLFLWIYSPINASDTRCIINIDYHLYARVSFAQSIIYLVPNTVDTYTALANETSLMTNFPLCRNTTILIAEQANHIVDTSYPTPSRGPNTGQLCRPQLDVQDFNVTFNAEGQIQTYKVLETTSSSTQSFFEGTTDFLATYHGAFGDSSMLSALPSSAESAGSPYDWPGLLTARLHHQVDPTSNLSDYEVLSKMSKQVYARIFSSWFSAYRDQLLSKSTSPSPVMGTAYFRQARMVPSVPLFTVAFTILTFYIIIAIVVIVTRRHRYTGPRMPKSLGSLVPWLTHSRMLRDFEGTHHFSSDARDGHLKGLGKRYGFGWFHGVDGKLHLGVEQEPLLERHVFDDARAPKKP